MHISEANLKKIVVASGIISDAQFEAARQEALRSNRTIGNVLIGKGDITENYFAEIVANYFTVPIVNFQAAPPDETALYLLPEQFSKTKRIALFAVDHEKKTAKLAMEDPGDLKTIDLVAVKIGMAVVPHLATASSMKIIFKEYKKDIYKEFDKIIEESIAEALEAGGLKDLEKMAEHVPIITITDGLMEYAALSGASDAHIERLPGKGLARHPTDGILRDTLRRSREIP